MFFFSLLQVQHSQRKREKLLLVWIIILKDTSISSAHCTCMAGLSEVCSHVATVLFYLHARPNTSEDSGPGPASTEKLSVWPVPPQKNVEMLRVRDMNLAGKKSQQRDLSQVHAPSLKENNQLDAFLTELQNLDINPAICLLMDPFASRMVTNELETLPPSLDNFYSPDLQGKSYEELLGLSQNIEMTIHKEQIDIIEAATREQAENNTWFKYRAGRITASRFKAVCRTNIEKPSLTVIKGVCYPQKVIFYSKQTSYGIKHEKNALEEYKEHMSGEHTNFTMCSSGFCISEKHSELGASPDSLVSCDCCGLGCVEVKCPYLLSDKSSLEEFANKKYTCLNFSNGEYSLDLNHCYYYQIQCQMFVTDRKYCDFVIWSKAVLYIERVFYNDEFCQENVTKALNFHKYVIKPELLSRYFTEKGGIGKLTLWCMCQQPDDGRPMLRCDSDDCETQWFHYDCINISVSATPSTWLCHNCNKPM